MELWEISGENFKRIKKKLSSTSKPQKKWKMLNILCTILFFGLLAMVAFLYKPDEAAEWDLKGTILVVGVIAVVVMLWKMHQYKKEIKEEVVVEANLEIFRKKESEEKTAVSLFGDKKFDDQAAEKRIAEKKAEKAMGAVATAIRESAHQEKEINWAVAGGLASGLGGPAAGVFAAADAMNRNSEIRAENKRNKEYANRLAGDMTKSIHQAILDSNNWLRDIGRLYHKQVKSTNWSLDSLFDQLNVKTIRQEADPRTGAVTVDAQCSCHNDDMWIDGAVRGKLYAKDGKLAGCVYLSLPLSGTMSSSSSTVNSVMTGHCAEPLIKCSDYDIKYEPINLWRLIPKYGDDIPAGDGTTEEEHNEQVKKYEDSYLAEFNRK